MTAAFRELPSAIMGRLGEIVAAREFKRDGFGVIASYKFSGSNDNEAPALETESIREITPDLDVCKRGERFWIEVKTYAEAAWNRTYKCWVHGVAVRHFENYVAVEQRTGSSVFLAINELKTGNLLLSNRPLSAMQKYGCLCGCNGISSRHRGSGGVRGPQWYFDRDTFTCRYKLDSGTLEDLRRQHARLIATAEPKPQSEPERQKSFFFSDVLVEEIDRGTGTWRGGHR